MSFNIALSGLNAASADLEVTSNNIANSSTTGFKQSRAEFADVYAVAYGGISQTAIGDGVALSAVTQQFQQGNIEFTENSLDLAVSGRGFFVVDDGGAPMYTRAGAFGTDKDGYVVNAQNQRLQVFQALDPAGTTFNTGSLSDLQLVTADAPPQATSSVDAILNLQADATDLNAAGIPAFDPLVRDPQTYNFASAITVYDSLGASHTATTYYRKTGVNSWESYLVVDNDGTQTTGAVAMNFDANGNLTTPMPVSWGAFNPGSGAAPFTLNYDFTGTTQYGSAFATNSLSQDGFTTGQLNSIAIDETGVVSALYTNGQSVALGKVALADFVNPQGLQQMGDTNWAETFASGAVQLGEPGTATLGLIQSGALEESNVDLAAELVNLITAQRNYQANAEVISTADSITQTIINIR